MVGFPRENLGKRLEFETVAVYDPSTGEWLEWKLPGSGPQAYAVYVDERGMVWLSDFGANSVLQFNPQSGFQATLGMLSAPSDH